jgi:hypothetical protein
MLIVARERDLEDLIENALEFVSPHSQLVAFEHL